MAYDAVVIREAVRDLGLRAEVEESPTWGSPFKHVYVFLTEARWEGRLVRVSPEREMVEGDGLLVGEFGKYSEVNAAEVQLLDSVDELVTWLAAEHV